MTQNSNLHTINPAISVLKEEMTVWRHHLHRYPETAFEEQKTTQFIIEKLRSFGIDELYTDFAPTGVVGIIKGNRAGRWIGLRADIDALDVTEQNSVPYASTIAGKMHACGHDGHTTMLLGAAKYLASHRDFSGVVVVIFQPAEENEGGGRVMVENGLFKRFPIDAVYGMHNHPNRPLNHFFIRKGPLMAAYDIFEIKITGKGSHAAAPHLGHDTIVTASQIINSLQTITSRNLDPLDSMVVSVTQIHSGDTWNVLPQEAIIRGTVRSFTTQSQDLAEKRINEIAHGVAKTFNAAVDVRYERRYPTTVNHPDATDLAVNVASKIVGADKVHTDVNPVMGAEDFSFMLQVKPGAYIWLGAGEGASQHHPQFNFNDEILTTGVAYFVEIVQTELG